MKALLPNATQKIKAGRNIFYTCKPCEGRLIISLNRAGFKVMESIKYKGNKNCEVCRKKAEIAKFPTLND